MTNTRKQLRNGLNQMASHLRKLFRPSTIAANALVLLMLASCVPNRKLVYLQKDDLKKKDIVRDSILRSYEMSIQEYIIQPLDILSIVFESITSDEYDFFQKISPQMRSGNQAAAGLSGIMVDADGYIEYPVVGKIKLTGMTIFEAQSQIQQVANQYLKDAVVRIRLLNFRVTVLGEVNSEQVVISSNPRMTMMEAVGMAGGLGELADRSKVKVIRQEGQQSHIFYINLLDEQYIESPYYFVQQNDIIVVPPLKQRTFRYYFIQNLGVFTTTLSTILLVVALFIDE